MGTKELGHTALLFSRAYSYEEYDVWSHPVNRGRLAEALLLSDRVFVHMTGLAEIQALAEELGSVQLLELVEAERVQFLLCPYSFARIRTQDRPWEIGFMADVAFLDVLEGRRRLGEVIQDKLSRVSYEVTDLGPDLVAALEETTLIADSDIPSTARRQLLQEFLDTRMGGEYERLLEKYLGGLYPVREVFRIEQAGDTCTISPRGDLQDPEVRRRADHVGDGLALLLEARQQSLLYAWAGADVVLTSPLFAESLAVESGSPDIGRILGADLEEGLNLATAVLKLPDVAFLVNRELVPLGHVARFSGSKNGSKVRTLFHEAVDGSGDGRLLQRHAEALYSDLLPDGGLQRLARSGLLELVVFAATQAIGILCPPAGIAVAVAEKGVRMTVVGRRPVLPVIKRHLVGRVLTRDVERERDREPPRDCRRPNSLRGWGHGKTKQVLPRSPGTSGSDGVRVRA
jgi:hypothetical protein